MNPCDVRRALAAPGASRGSLHVAPAPGSAPPAHKEDAVRSRRPPRLLSNASPSVCGGRRDALALQH